MNASDNPNVVNIDALAKVHMTLAEAKAHTPNGTPGADFIDLAHVMLTNLIVAARDGMDQWAVVHAVADQWKKKQTAKVKLFRGRR
jgi:hypothetical protein